MVTSLGGRPLRALALLFVLATAVCHNRDVLPVGKAAAATHTGPPAAPAAVPDAAPGDAPRAAVRGRVRVALLLPLTGPHADVGRNLLDAALLAQFSYADGELVLMPFDTGGQPPAGAEAAAQAVAAGAGLIIGPVFSDVVAAAAPVALEAGVSLLALSNDSAVARAGVYLPSLLPETQIARVVDYAIRQGMRRFAALLPAGRFGERVRSGLAAALAAQDLEPAIVSQFDRGEGSVAAAVRTLRDSRERGAGREPSAEGFEALVVAASGKDLTRLAAQLGHFDLDGSRVQLFGLASWSSPQTGQEPALVGGWFADVPKTRVGDFRRSFRKAFGSEPEGFAVVAYDMVALAAIRASTTGGGRFDRAVLTDPSGFAGAGGVFRLLENGRSEHLLEVREVYPRESRILEPAVTRFERR